MNITSEYPTKIVVDHTFSFTSGQAFKITVSADEDVVDLGDRFEARLVLRDAEDRPVVQRSTVYKQNLTVHEQVARTIVNYPAGKSPADLAIQEIDERNKQRIAARRPQRNEGVA